MAKEKNTKERLELNLTSLERVVINTFTQEEYTTLMQVYEYGGWTWCNGELPTNYNIWEDKNIRTCVDACNESCHEDIELYKNLKWDIISSQKFYEKQNITPEKIQKIKEYFENGK